MVEEKTGVPNFYELVDKDGDVVPFKFTSALEAGLWAKREWPDQEQDEDRSGKGWDIQLVDA